MAIVNRAQTALFEIPMVSVHHKPVGEWVMPGVALTPEIEALLANNAPVAVGVSGGKDGSVAALLVFKHLDKIGHSGPRILIHADLGSIEWVQSGEICRRLAAKLGVELIVVRREKGDMMSRWLQRWSDNLQRYHDLSCVKLILPWSTAGMRFCTGELKGGPIARKLVQLFPGQRIISISGIRRAESAARAKKPVTSEDARLTNKTLNTTGIDWNACIELSDEDVWAAHHQYDLPIHPAYSEHGNGRVSCSFCVLGSEKDWRCSTTCESNHPVYREIVDLEITSTFGFKSGLWLADVAPHLLTARQRELVFESKYRAKRRMEAEAALPKHLLFKKGWPDSIPSFAEACLIHQVREEAAQIVDIKVGCSSPDAVLSRYEYLFKIGEAKRAAKASSLVEEFAGEGEDDYATDATYTLFD